MGGHSEGSIGVQGASISETGLHSVANLAAIAFERTRSRQLLGQAEAARQNEELKSTLLDAIAHEFKTPLTSIKAAVSALLSDSPADANVKELLTIIDEESDRMNFLVSEAIEMARIEAGEIQVRREPHALPDLVAGSLKKLRSVLADRQVAVAIPDDLPQCCADRGLIEMVITQLLGNAAKYSEPLAPIRLSAEADGSSYRRQRRGSGPGHSRKPAGPGLREVLPGSRAPGTHTRNRHGARHRAPDRGGPWRKDLGDEPAGEGSQFCFSLPIARAGRTAMSNARILVVDDEPQIRRVMRATLVAQGYFINDARSGEDALERLREEKYDLVLLDMNMPGMGGMAACRAIREQWDVAIVVLTVRNTERDKVEALDAGADDYVTKPFSMPELLARIRAALRRLPLSAEGAAALIVAGGLEINAATRRVIVRNKEIRLTPKEFDLLHYLASHPNVAIPHGNLLQAVWGPDYGGEVEYLRVFVNQLRKKIELNPSKPEYLLTEPWIGYRFNVP